MLRFSFFLTFFAVAALARAQVFAVVGVARALAVARAQEPSTTSISREVKDVFDKSAKAVVKVRGTDEHG